MILLSLQVFPKHIAELLKGGHRPPIEELAEVSVFFTDIVGFTVISSTLSPSQVASMLDRLYCKFDVLIAAYDLYKVSILPPSPSLL